MHISTLHYTADFDFPQRDADPVVSYMIAAVPRSGSTFLSLKLWQTGCLGAPLEYANAKILADTGIGERLGGGDFGAFWRAVKHRRTSPNGVFAYKLFKQHFLEIGQRHPGVLDDIAPTHVIYLTRSDRLAHAVSYSRAIRSNVWFAGGRADETDYDRAHIAKCEDNISRQMEFWEKVFHATGADVHRVEYEAFCADPDAGVRAIAQRMGVRLEGQGLAIPLTERQRDAKSSAWEHAYREDAVAVAAGG